MYWQSPKSVWEIKVRLKLPKKIICVGNLGFVKHNINKKQWQVSCQEELRLHQVLSSVSCCGTEVLTSCSCTCSMQKKLRVHHSVLAQINQLLLVATDFVLSCFPPLESVSVGARQSLQVFHSTPSFLLSHHMAFKCSL